MEDLRAQEPVTTIQPSFQGYSSQMQPVPKEGFQEPDRAAANPQRPGWDLRWRKSSNTPTAKKATSLQLKTSATAATPSYNVVRQVSGEAPLPSSQPTTGSPTTGSPASGHPRLQVAGNAPALNPIRVQAQSAHPRDRQHAPSPSGVAHAQWITQPQENAEPAPDYFVDPFGNSETRAALTPPVSASPAAISQGAMQIPRSRLSSGMPLELRPANGLRANIAQLELPGSKPPTASSPAGEPVKAGAKPAEPNKATLNNTTPEPTLQLAPPKPEPTPALTQPALTQPAPPPVPALPLPDQSATPATKPKATADGPSLGEIIKQRTPEESETKQNATPALPEPPLRENVAPPTQSFHDQLRNADQADLDRLNQGQAEPHRFGRSKDVLEDLPFSCDDFRKRIAAQTIDQVSLDISPPYRPDEMDDERFQVLKEKFDEKQAIRTWHDRNGDAILTGRLRDLAYEKAVIQTASGSEDALPINQLSEGDIAYIAENWGLPKECLIEQVAYKPRKWTPSTMTWKASNLCHNPLYFEDVNLERYGHTHGPLLEPVVQSAHFFANIAILPYKMGVHCPRECQYALGYYRPGNCAPWIKPPVPISARGAISQAAAMTGMFWLIP